MVLPSITRPQASRSMGSHAGRRKVLLDAYRCVHPQRVARAEGVVSARFLMRPISSCEDRAQPRSQAAQRQKRAHHPQRTPESPPADNGSRSNPPVRCARGMSNGCGRAADDRPQAQAILRPCPLASIVHWRTAHSALPRNARRGGAHARAVLVARPRTPPAARAAGAAR